MIPGALYRVGGVLHVHQDGHPVPPGALDMFGLPIVEADVRDGEILEAARGDDGVWRVPEMPSGA